MWSRLIRSSFSSHLSSFLAGVLASVAVNLFTGVVLLDKAIARPGAMVVSITLFLVSSGGAAVVAWYLDEMHWRWLDEGRPTDPVHVKRIVRTRLVQATIAAIITVAAISIGGFQCYVATLPVK